MRPIIHSCMFLLIVALFAGDGLQGEDVTWVRFLFLLRSAMILRSPSDGDAHAHCEYYAESQTN